MTLNSALSIPSSSARRRATSSISSEASVLISLPRGLTSSAPIRPVSPGPAASSRIVCPGWGSTWSTSQRDTAAPDAWKDSRWRSQPEAAPPQRSRDRARYSSGSSSTCRTLLEREPHPGGLRHVALRVDCVLLQLVAAPPDLEAAFDVVGLVPLLGAHVDVG